MDKNIKDWKKHFAIVYVLMWGVAIVTKTTWAALFGSLLGCMAGPLGVLIGTELGIIIQYLIK